jgi:uncharacterized protein (DUF1697 family)
VLGGGRDEVDEEQGVTTFVALLRAVNVGGRNMVAMDDLRRLLAETGMSEVRSLLQSGNLVFRDAKNTGGARGGAALEQRLEAEAAKRLDLHTEFHVRTAGEWDAIVARNPFRAEAKGDPGHLLMMCFKETLDLKRVKVLQAAIPGRERFEAAGREAYVVYPDGIGTSKLTTARIDKTLGARGTGRNWNPVLKLAAAAGG